MMVIRLYDDDDNDDVDVIFFVGLQLDFGDSVLD